MQAAWDNKVAFTKPERLVAVSITVGILVSVQTLTRELDKGQTRKALVGVLYSAALNADQIDGLPHGIYEWCRKENSVCPVRKPPAVPELVPTEAEPIKDID